MAKTNRMICLDGEINEKLKGVESASFLINRLLRHHFAEDLTEDELREAKVAAEIEIEKLTTKLKHIDRELEDYQNSPIKGMISRSY